MHPIDPLWTSLYGVACAGFGAGVAVLGLKVATRRAAAKAASGVFIVTQVDIVPDAPLLDAHALQVVDALAAARAADTGTGPAGEYVFRKRYTTAAESLARTMKKDI